MKKLIILFVCLFAALAMYSQSATVLENKDAVTAVTVSGTGTGTSTLNVIQGEYDVSIQLIPALTGSGDSLDFSYIVYQSNSTGTAVWTPLAAADTVSSALDTDAIYNITDFTGLRLKVTYTGISTDTIEVTPYSVYKKHANE